METKFQNIFIFHQHINIQRYQVSKEKTILRSYLKDKKKKKSFTHRSLVLYLLWWLETPSTKAQRL